MREDKLANIVNLNRVRKAKARETARDKADANRIAFGRTKAEKSAAALDTERATRDLDGAKREKT
jgi:hypothetical protein